VESGSIVRSTAVPRAIQNVRASMTGPKVTQDLEDYLLTCVVEAAAECSGIQACIKLSLALGIVEEALTRKKDPFCPEIQQLKVPRCV
jgi:hypothetical protein